MDKVNKVLLWNTFVNHNALYTLSLFVRHYWISHWFPQNFNVIKQNIWRHNGKVIVVCVKSSIGWVSRADQVYCVHSWWDAMRNSLVQNKISWKLLRGYFVLIYFSWKTNHYSNLLAVTAAIYVLYAWFGAHLFIDLHDLPCLVILISHYFFYIVHAFECPSTSQRFRPVTIQHDANNLPYILK